MVVSVTYQVYYIATNSFYFITLQLFFSNLNYLNYFSFCQMMTLDVICTTAFGVDVNSCKDPDNELLKQGRDVSKQFTAGNILAMLCCKYALKYM